MHFMPVKDFNMPKRPGLLRRCEASLTLTLSLSETVCAT